MISVEVFPKCIAHVQLNAFLERHAQHGELKAFSFPALTPWVRRLDQHAGRPIGGWGFRNRCAVISLLLPDENVFYA